MTNEIIQIPNDISIQEMSKKELILSADNFIKKIIDDGEDGLTRLAFACKLHEYTKQMIDSASKLLIDDLSKYDNNKTNILGVEMQICETGFKYDFSNTPFHVNILLEMEKLDTEKKKLESLAKIIKMPTDYLVESTGEVVTVHPATHTSTTTIKKTVK